MSDLEARVEQVLALDPADHATKSRDYGRGFAECLRVVQGLLRGEEPDQPRRLIDMCLEPGCRCNGDYHP